MFNYCPPKVLPDLESVTDPVTGKRFYCTPNGVKLPSVTTVLGASKKASIAKWRASVGEEVANKISRHATSRGTAVHLMCENYLNNKPYGKDMMPDDKEIFLSIKPLLNRINNIHYQEAALWSENIGLAGRVDCIAEFDGVLSVIDFKTASKPKKKEYISDYFAQCVAYSCMYEELIGNPVGQIVIIMAVHNSEPLLFIEKTEDHIETLFDYIEFYRKNS